MRQQMIGAASVALLVWAGYLMYDMNELKKDPKFQERFGDAVDSPKRE